MSAPSLSTTRFNGSVWLHRLALLTVGCTAGLLALGGIVTSFHVGMADPVWPTTPWFLFFISWQEPSAGFLIEHSHRLAGYVVGMCAIALTVAAWRSEQRTSIRILVTLALLAVIVQGLLGGFRVVLHALMGTNLALIHGTFAQLVFSLLVIIAFMTSSSWSETLPGRDRSATSSLFRRALFFVGFAIAQLIFGAMLRHLGTPLSQRLHLLTAFLVFATGLLLVRVIYAEYADDLCLVRLGNLFSGLLACQIVLGVEAWCIRFASGINAVAYQPVTVSGALTRTAHQFLGSWVLAAGVLLAVRSYQVYRASHPLGVDGPMKPVPVLAEELAVSSGLPVGGIA